MHSIGSIPIGISEEKLKQKREKEQKNRKKEFNEKNKRIKRKKKIILLFHVTQKNIWLFTLVNNLLLLVAINSWIVV